jgi:hypothetical protein
MIHGCVYFHCVNKEKVFEMYIVEQLLMRNGSISHVNFRLSPRHFLVCNAVIC